MVGVYNLNCSHYHIKKFNKEGYNIELLIVICRVIFLKSKEMEQNLQMVYTIQRKRWLMIFRPLTYFGGFSDVLYRLKAPSCVCTPVRELANCLSLRIMIVCSIHSSRSEVKVS